MATDYTIRRAKASIVDAQIIQHIEQMTVGSSPYNWEYIQNLLGLDGQYHYLAFIGQEPVGFCSCFETPLNGRQLEIDLIGVLSTYRNCGVATSMVQTICEQARQRGASFFRAVVADDNAASQRAFIQAGLQRSPQAAEMMVYRLEGTAPVVTSFPSNTRLNILPAVSSFSEHASAALFQIGLWDNSALAGAECLMVQTVAYKGIWIERLHGQEDWLIALVRALLGQAAEWGVDEVGILCNAATCSETGQLALWRAGFQSLGRYYTFT